jgi:hypothetical protein
VEKQLKDPRLLAQLSWPHATPDHVARAYRLIANGLRASAERELGRLGAEADALVARRAILGERLEETNREEIAREQMLAEAQLAWNAGQRRDATAASEWLRRALARADDLRGRAHGVSDHEQLDVLWLAAELTVALRRTLVADLPQRLAATAEELRSRREPSLRAYQRWFEIYAPLVAAPVGGMKQRVALSN